MAAKDLLTCDANVGTVGNRTLRVNKPRLRGKAAMLTWIGNFGLLEFPGRTKDEAGTWSLDTLVSVLQEDRRAKAIVEELSSKVKHELAKNFGFWRWSMCVQVCPETVVAKKDVQVHCHCFSEADKWLDRRLNATWDLYDQTPNIQNSIWENHRAARNHTAGGHYYCVAPVRGLVWCESTHEPFKHYSQNAELITLLFHKGKLTPDAAKAEYVRCKREVK